VIALASGVGFSLLSIGSAVTAGPAPNPSELAASAAPSGAPSALEEACAAKRTAESYRIAGGLTKAAASWTHAAEVYEGVGNFGEAALAWTEAASLHEQENEPQDQVQALIHLEAKQCQEQFSTSTFRVRPSLRIVETRPNRSIIAVTHSSSPNG
jgi:hypothetical protein